MYVSDTLMRILLGSRFTDRDLHLVWGRVDPGRVVPGRAVPGRVDGGRVDGVLVDFADGLGLEYAAVIARIHDLAEIAEGADNWGA